MCTPLAADPQPHHPPQAKHPIVIVGAPLQAVHCSQFQWVLLITCCAPTIVWWCPSSSLRPYCVSHPSYLFGDSCLVLCGEALLCSPCWCVTPCGDIVGAVPDCDVPNPFPVDVDSRHGLGGLPHSQLVVNYRPMPTCVA